MDHIEADCMLCGTAFEKYQLGVLQHMVDEWQWGFRTGLCGNKLSSINGTNAEDSNDVTTTVRVPQA